MESLTPLKRVKEPVWLLTQPQMNGLPSWEECCKLPQCVHAKNGRAANTISEIATTCISALAGASWEEGRQLEWLTPLSPAPVLSLPCCGGHCLHLHLRHTTPAVGPGNLCRLPHPPQTRHMATRSYQVFLTMAPCCQLVGTAALAP